MDVDVKVLAQFTELMSRYDHVRSINRLADYRPYPYQVRFHNAEGKDTPGRPAAQRLLCAANKIGKTAACAMEVAMHATGRYPDWFKGCRFNHPVDIMCCGLTNESVRDIIQAELMGDPTAIARLGQGSVPKETISGKPRAKPGVQNAFDIVRIRHKSGYESRIFLRAYEQGWKKFQGIAFDVIWADEEPDAQVWSQLLRATIAKKWGIILCSMTPEQGMTEVVSGFWNDLKYGQAMINATWEDAKHPDGTTHLTAEKQKQLMEAWPKHERDMRTKGIPLAGRGLIWPVLDDEISIEPIQLPRHWPRITGIDFGWDHPFAAACLAWDRDQDIVYMTAEYKESHALPIVHAQSVRAWGDWIPVAWPHDGLNTEKGTGVTLADQYRNAGLNMLPWRATNAPVPGQKEGEGGNSVEAPVLDLLERMQTGRFKVFSSCQEFFKEKRMYHRDERGQIVKLNDDVLSAARYAFMMLRHARTQSVLPKKRSSFAQRLTNWG